jgi:hypothetical protein
MREVTVDTRYGKHTIIPTWRGKHLAVHKYIVGNDGDGPVFTSQSKLWQVTHIKAGRSMAGYKLDGCTLLVVKRLAELWDNAAGKIDPEKPREWKLAPQWADACRIASSIGVATPPPRGRK